MTKPRFIVFGGLAVCILGFVTFLVWERYQGYAESRNYKAMEEEYIKTMTEDTYGGKTPQETLDLFVAALKSEDVELASKYFMLDDATLSQDKWLKMMTSLKERNLLQVLVKDISGAREYSEGKTSDDDFKFAAYTDDGVVGAVIDMWFNPYSKAWKIENI